MSSHDGPFSEDQSPRRRSIVIDKPGAPHPHLLRREETRPDVIARLEWLDDLMFAAIDGDANSLQAAADAWRKARGELGDDTVEESRQQYLRCAGRLALAASRTMPAAAQDLCSD